MLVLFKLIFTAIGFRYGKLQGALIGFILGYALDAGLSSWMMRFRMRKKMQSRMRSEVDTVFLVSTFSILAKLVKVDGVVSKEEIAAVDHVMKNVLSLKKKRRREAMKIFNVAKNSTTSFHYYAAQFYNIFANQPQVLTGLLEILKSVALADGPLNEKERRLITSAAEIFGLNANLGGDSRSEPKAPNQKSTSERSCYEVLGCESTDTLEVIKQRYRKLAADYHPDKIAAKSLPEDFIAFANDKFREIHTAYQTIKKIREEKEGVSGNHGR